MKTTVEECDFIKAFENHNNFTYKGLVSLFNYFEQFEEETGEEIWLDVIYICCNYTEFSNIKELKENYYIPFEDEKKIREYLEDRTKVVSFEKDSIIIFRY